MKTLLRNLILVLPVGMTTYAVATALPYYLLLTTAKTLSDILFIVSFFYVAMFLTNLFPWLNQIDKNADKICTDEEDEMID